MSIHPLGAGSSTAADKLASRQPGNLSTKSQLSGGRAMARDDEYEVGYRKPPKHAQFKKGQSGNPRGRRRGSRNYRIRFHEIINEKVTITENGRRRRMAKFDVAWRQTMNKAAGGDFRAMKLLLDAYERFALHEHKSEPITFIFAPGDEKL